MFMERQRDADEAKSSRSLSGAKDAHSSSSSSKLSLIVSRHSPERSKYVSNNVMISSSASEERTMVMSLQSTGVVQRISRQCVHTAPSLEG